MKIDQEKIEKYKWVSFSALKDFLACGWYFYLKKIEKLKTYQTSIWTHYGTLVHKYVQLVLQEKMDPEKAAKMFIRVWFRFCRLYKKQLKEQYKKGNPEDLYKNPVRVIMSIKKAFKEKFGEYKVISVEHKLNGETNFPQKFFGLIDIALEVQGKIQHIIADFKTCNNAYMFNKYRDKWDDYQLILYKHFYGQEKEIDPKKIDTYFVTIAKDPKTKQPLGFTRITSGPKKTQNALKWMNNTLTKVDEKRFLKDYSACNSKFYGKSCPFKGTKYCDAR